MSLKPAWIVVGSNPIDIGGEWWLDSVWTSRKAALQRAGDLNEEEANKRIKHPNEYEVARVSMNKTGPGNVQYL